MGDKDNGALLFRLELHQLILHLGTDQRIEGRERFVHQQNIGVDRKGAGKANALTHAAGEFIRVSVGVVLQPHLTQRIQRFGLALASRHSR